MVGKNTGESYHARDAQADDDLDDDPELHEHTLNSKL
jgi:hypothetical protein